MTFLRWRSLSQRASLATLVVLPEPCKPAMSTTAGGCARRFNSALASPMIRISSSWTILINT